MVRRVGDSSGDSLVDKVFEEGLKSADAMVIVLSSNSIDKPWVREEINAGFVKRVEGKCKLIPVLIDDVTVPEALASTVCNHGGSGTLSAPRASASAPRSGSLRSPRATRSLEASV